jgi:hypothetical protein
MEGNADRGEDYVLFASHWRYGSGMMLPHSTQRTLPTLWSSSETQSEIIRLCVHAQSGGVGRGGSVPCPGSLGFRMHLRDGRILVADVLYPSSPESVMQDTKYRSGGGRLLVLSGNLIQIGSYRDALCYVLRRKRGLSLTETILTRSRRDTRPTTLFSSVTARWRIPSLAMSRLASRTVQLMSI